MFGGVYQVTQFINFNERKKGCIWSSSNPSGKHPATKMLFGRPDLYYQNQGMKRIPMKRCKGNWIMWYTLLETR